MKVTRDTPDQLIIENNPVWLAVAVSAFAFLFIVVGLFTLQAEIFVGIAFIVGGSVIGIVFNLAFIRRTQLILNRTDNLVELRRKSLLGYKRRTWELEFLNSAIVQSSYSGDTNTHRAALIFDDGMDAGTHPITLVYSSGSGAERAMTAINTWLATSLDSSPTTS
ncbi:MAG: hypothetical protein ACSHWS_00375 [Sulfitobacter sp.]